jgi:hypothetical protein
MARKPVMPTYLSAASVLEKKTGSGWKLAGWTLLRMLLIAPPILLITPNQYHRRIWLGAALSSGLISGLALLRIFSAGQNGVGSPRLGRARSMKRLRA